MRHCTENFFYKLGSPSANKRQQKWLQLMEHQLMTQLQTGGQKFMEKNLVNGLLNSTIKLMGD